MLQYLGTLRKRLLLMFMLTTGSTLLVVIVFFVHESLGAVRQSLVRDFSIVAEATAKNMDAPLLFGAFDDTHTLLLEHLENHPEIIYAALYFPSRGLLSEYTPPHPLQQYRKNSHKLPIKIHQEFHEKHLDIARPVIGKQKIIAWVYLQVDLSRLDARIKTYAVFIPSVLLIALTIAFVLADLLQRTISRPLLHLLGIIKKVSTSKNYQLRARPHGGEELQGLMQGFNDMLQQIEQHQKELQKAKQDAEEANQIKSRFLAAMSHEIRTPMNAILGFNHLLRQQIKDPQQSEYLRVMYNSGESLLKLINDMLDLSKLEASQLHLEYSELNIRTLAQELENLFWPQIQQKQLNFTLKINENVPHFIYLDEARLRQILFNLLGNAIKFTAQGEVTLRIHAVPIEQGNKMDLQIEVEDTGIGIKPEEQAKIFAAFGQQSSQRREEYGGLGLGLTITQRLMNLMQGTVEFRSTLGSGTCFYLHFPQVEKVEHDEPVASLDTTRTLDIQNTSPSVSPLPETLQRLTQEKQLFARWQAFSSHSSINEIEVFAQEILCLGEEHQYNRFVLWAQSILKAIELFDINQMQMYLKQFPQLMNIRQ